jgi:hypothetical protein
MADLAALEVLNNVYLCMAIADQHPTAYARLMLVSRRFYDWLNGKEEIVGYDRASQEFRKKVTDKKAFKQKYKESWVVKKVEANGESTRFLHSRRLHSIGDQPSYIARIGAHLTRSWTDNGREHRENGPAEISIWSFNQVTAKEFVWRKHGYKYRENGPARIYVQGRTREEDWHDDHGPWKTVGFVKVGNRWVPNFVTMYHIGHCTRMGPFDSRFPLLCGRADDTDLDQ